MASPLVWSYLVYLAVALLMVVWVGRTLYSNGAAFLRHVFAGDQDLAVAVNRLLLVGFYLINIGFILLTSSLGADTTNVADRYQALTIKLGSVAVILGVMHFVNLSALSRARRRGLTENRPGQGGWNPPVAAGAPVH
jgi:hypothetical protein